MLPRGHGPVSHQQAGRGRRGEDAGDLVLLDELVGTFRARMIERALVGDRRAADEEGREHDVAVADDPTDVARRPPHVVGAEGEHPLRHRIDVDLIAAVRVHGELRLRGGAARREDVGGLVRLERDVRIVVAATAREEVVPGQLFGNVVGAGRAAENDDVLDRRRRRDGLIDDRQERNVLPLPVGQVRREERPGAGEPHALAERARAEAREDDEDDDPDADRAEHEDDRLGRGRHVDRDAIALHKAHRAKRRPHALGLPVQVGVRECSAFATLVLGDQSDVAATSGRDVMVDGVVREVRHAARVPTEGRRLPVEDALPLLEPRQLLGGAAPELLGVVGGLFAPRANGLERIGLAHPEARSRSLKRWIFPVTVLGSSGTNSIQRGYL